MWTERPPPPCPSLPPAWSAHSVSEFPGLSVARFIRPMVLPGRGPAAILSFRAPRHVPRCTPPRPREGDRIVVHPDVLAIYETLEEEAKRGRKHSAAIWKSLQHALSRIHLD